LQFAHAQLFTCVTEKGTYDEMAAACAQRGAALASIHSQAENDDAVAACAAAIDADGYDAWEMYLGATRHGTVGQMSDWAWADGSGWGYVAPGSQGERAGDPFPTQGQGRETRAMMYVQAASSNRCIDHMFKEVRCGTWVSWSDPFGEGQRGAVCRHPPATTAAPTTTWPPTPGVEDLVALGLPTSPSARRRTNGVGGIALDVDGIASGGIGKMYFAFGGGGAFGTDGVPSKIQRANLDGSNVEELLSSLTSGLGTPTGLALDLAGGKMYWSQVCQYQEGEDPPNSRCGNRDSIQRANLDGTGMEAVYRGKFPWRWGWLHHPYGITLDVSAGKVYWADSFQNRITRANMDPSQNLGGHGVENIVDASVKGGHRRRRGLPRGMTPENIALDVACGKMYWSDSSSKGKKIQRANLDGSDLEDVYTSDQPDDYSPDAIALDASEGKMYFTENNYYRSKFTKTKRANLDGSNVEDLGLFWGKGGEYIALDLAGGKMYGISVDSAPPMMVQRANIPPSTLPGSPRCTSTTTTTTTAPCFDSHPLGPEKCRRLARQGKCGTSEAGEHCKDTCGLCDPDPTTTTPRPNCAGKVVKTCAKLAKNHKKKCTKNDKFKKCKAWEKKFGKKKCEKKCGFPPLGSKNVAAFNAESSLEDESSATNKVFGVALVVSLGALVAVALLLVGLVVLALRRRPEVAARSTRRLDHAEKGNAERKVLMA